MADYLIYWKPGGVADATQKLHWAAGSQVEKVQPGDVVWAVSMPKSGVFELMTRF
jgi:hypothetical protein